MSKPYSLFRDRDGKLPPKVINVYRNTIKTAQEIYRTSIDRVPEKHRVTDMNQYNEIVRDIFRVAERDLLDNKGGVVLDKIGYFCHWMTPIKRTYYSRHTKELHTNLFTGGYWYNSAMFTWVFGRNHFKGWSMESSFSYRFGRKFYKKLQEGMKYNIYVKLISSIYNGDINYGRKVYNRLNKLKKIQS